MAKTKHYGINMGHISSQGPPEKFVQLCPLPHCVKFTIEFLAFIYLIHSQILFRVLKFCGIREIASHAFDRLADNPWGPCEYPVLPAPCPPSPDNNS